MALCRAVGDAPTVAQDDHRILGARHRRVEQVAVMHEGVRLVGDDNGAGKLRALHLVDRRRVGQLDVVRRHPSRLRSAPHARRSRWSGCRPCPPRARRPWRRSSRPIRSRSLSGSPCRRRRGGAAVRAPTSATATPLSFNCRSRCSSMFSSTVPSGPLCVGVKTCTSRSRS